MENILGRQYRGDTQDSTLVTAAQKGSRQALEDLLKKHRDWIYNLALRMVSDPDDAFDVTQEIIIKIVTKLSAFRKQSSFRTWLYRIVANHILNMKRCLRERVFSSFGKHERFKEQLEQLPAEDHHYTPPEEKLLIEETKEGCMSGMLLCLNRTQRLVFILGNIFNVNSTLGGAIMEMTADNFRQILSRAKIQLNNYMNGKCSLVNEENPCRCERKTRALIRMGIVDPETIAFKQKSVERVNDFVRENKSLVDDAVAVKVQKLFQNQPLYKEMRLENILAAILKKKNIREFVNYE